MEILSPDTRLDQIPVIHVRGTHKIVGYVIGRQCKSMIEDVINRWTFFNKVLLLSFQNPRGKFIYDQSLRLCKQKFPQYVEELEGMAEGSTIPFYKLFLLHIDTFVVQFSEGDNELLEKVAETGCTTIMCNSDETIIGHTEDACPEFLNNIFILSAEILDKDGKKLEKFTTLAYAGYLPGYTMGYNEHGLIYTVNTLFLKKTLVDRTPRLFLARAILKASNFAQVLDILRDVGCGSGDGFSLNIHFSKQEGTPVMHNVEISPPDAKDSKKESELSVLTLTHGDVHTHCNKYQRISIPEEHGVAFTSSEHRQKAISRYLKPTSMLKIKEVLSDQSDQDYPVFRCGSPRPDYVKTVAVGIFDILKKEWSIYIGPPKNSEPVLVLPLQI